MSLSDGTVGADPVLPMSLEHDTECLRKLGITRSIAPVPPRPRPRPTPDTDYETSRPHDHATAHGVFAVRLLMNPSLHHLMMQRILADAGVRFGVAGHNVTVSIRVGLAVRIPRGGCHTSDWPDPFPQFSPKSNKEYQQLPERIPGS